MATIQAQEIEYVLRSRRVPGLFPDETAGEYLLPDYAGRSLVNVPATLSRLLGAPLPGIAPPLPESYWGDLAHGVRRVVVVLLDALGYRYLEESLSREPHSLWGRLAERGVLLPMTSVYPSTTATALASLFTGAEPLAHGLLGYELWLREYGVLTQMLTLQPVYSSGKETLLDWGFVPEDFLPVPTLGVNLAHEGIRVRTRAFLPTPIVRGALTRMIYRGFQQIYGYANVDGLWALAHHVLKQDTAGPDSPTLYALYWGGIDGAIHLHGTGGGAWQVELRSAARACEERFLSQLSPSERQGTLLIVLADHGFVDAPLALAHDTEADAVLKSQLLVPYSGEARAAFLHSIRGEDEHSRQAIQEALGPGYRVCRSTDIMQAGLFGSADMPAPEARVRLGHFMAIPRGQHYLDRKVLREKLRGRHGGLSPEEMLIPWLAVRLDDWGAHR